MSVVALVLAAVVLWGGAVSASAVSVKEHTWRISAGNMEQKL